MNKNAIITIDNLYGCGCDSYNQINEDCCFSTGGCCEVDEILVAISEDLCDVEEDLEDVEKNLYSATHATVYWHKMYDAARIPTKREEDAGFDIYTISGSCVLKPFETRKFKTGIRSAFSKDFWMEVKERGSTGSIGLSVRSGVIDSGYRGEWIIVLTNLNPFPIEFSSSATEVKTEVWDWWFLKGKTKKIIYPLSKAIAQAVLVPLPKISCKPWDEEKIAESERGDTGFGASGK